MNKIHSSRPRKQYLIGRMDMDILKTQKKRRGQRAVCCAMKLTPDIPPSSTHLTRVCIMCLYWCQYEKFTININVFDDSFFNSKQYLSDRLTTFVIGLTKLRYRWKHYKECVSSTSSETTSTFLNILVCSLNRIR